MKPNSLVFVTLICFPMKVDYADLAVVDLSKFSTPEGREELATLVRDAMRTQGFFYVVNHGMTSEQVCHILFDVCNPSHCLVIRRIGFLISVIFLSLKSLMRRKRSTLGRCSKRDHTKDTSCETTG